MCAGGRWSWSLADSVSEGVARRAHVTCARTLQGLVALADASAQCSRSGPSSSESVSGFATPPPPSSFRLLWGDSEHANFAGKIDSFNPLPFRAPAAKHGACSWARGCCVQAETWVRQARDPMLPYPPQEKAKNHGPRCLIPRRKLTRRHQPPQVWLPVPHGRTSWRAPARRLVVLGSFPALPLRSHLSVCMLSRAGGAARNLIAFVVWSS
jgi:hypothetical protein